MTNALRAELIKLRRPRVLATAAALAALFAVAAALATVLPAQQGDGVERAGGATEAFAAGLSFTGILVFVLFIANVAGEFTQGTFRTLLMRQPHRFALLGGKLAALLAFAACLLAVALVLTALASTLAALATGISPGAWFGADGILTALGDYARVLLGWSAWGLLGAALAVLVRSTPIALGLGIAWSAPIEHILQDVWRAAGDWFPGLLLEGLVARGTVEPRAVALVALYVALALGAATVALRRRDMVG